MLPTFKCQAVRAKWQQHSLRKEVVSYFLHGGMNPHLPHLMSAPAHAHVVGYGESGGAFILSPEAARQRS